MPPTSTTSSSSRPCGVGAGEWSLDGALGLDLAATGWALGALGAGALGGLGAVLSARLVAEVESSHGEPHPA